MQWLFCLFVGFIVDDDPELSAVAFNAVEQCRANLSQCSFELTDTLEWPKADPPRKLRLDGRIEVMGDRRRFSWETTGSVGEGASVDRIVMLTDGKVSVLHRESQNPEVAKFRPASVSIFSEGVKPIVDPMFCRTSDLVWFTDNVYEFRSIVRHLDGPPVSRPSGKPFVRKIERDGDTVDVSMKFSNGFETSLKVSFAVGGNVIEHRRKEPPQGTQTSWIYSTRSYQWEHTPDGIWWPKKFERKDTIDSETGELMFSDTVEVKEFLGIAKSKDVAKKSVSLKDLGELKPGTMVTEYRPGSEPKSYTVGKEKTESFEEAARRMGNSLRQGSVYKAKK